jgi:uncharacterized protein (TIGR02600 family)
MLVLIVILVIGFLGHVTAHSKSSTSYRDQTGTLLLGDIAVNIVKGQIDAAVTSTGTTMPGGIWASQPGAIRTISSTGSQTMYKLYSSSAMTDAATSATLKADILADLPTTTATANNDWAGSALWTDLNAPVMKSDGTNAYPLIDIQNDPADLPLYDTTKTTAPFTAGSFNIDTTAAVNPVGAAGRSTTASTSSYPLPMPVRWLYVLKQGQIISPDSTSSATQLTFKNAPTQPVSTPGNSLTDNPIIGRIAFWTDDDTSRVNINTASHGTFWDTPRFTSTDDVALSANQPVNKEYQRYPGHAAMTTLSLALPEFAPSGTVTLGAGGTAESLIGLTPRYFTGGSTEGTVASTYASTGLGNPGKANRLYASVNELLFDPPSVSSGTRTASSLTKNQVEAAKFFLTAHSRGPELNLFGEPRIAIWPISSLANTTSDTFQTTSDQLIAFCSTTPAPTSLNAGAAPSQYYFVRTPHFGSSYPLTNTTTLNFGAYVAGLLGSNSSTSDVNLPRNVSLLSYLDNLTKVVLPGKLSASATFESKYTQLRKRQILTEIFDYIRITNARDALLDPVTGSAFAPANAVTANVPYAAPTSNSFSSNSQADGQIWPTYYATWNTYGYGRFSGTVVEVSLIFVGVGNSTHAVQANQASTSPTWKAANSTLVPPAGNTAVQAMFVVTTFDPALGFSQASPDLTITVSGLNTLKLNTTAMNFPAAGTYTSGGGERYDGRPGNAGSIRAFPNMLASTQFKSNSYPFFSDIINVPNSTGLMALTGGGPITVNVYPLNTTTVTPIYSYSIDLSGMNSSSTSAGNIPIPAYSVRPLFGSIRTPASSNLATADRFDAWATNSNNDANGETVTNIIDSFDDTVISMVPTAAYGDYRMLAPYSLTLSSSPLAGAFQVHPNFTTLTATSRLAYGMEYAGGHVGRGSTQGTLVTSASYYGGTASGVNPGPQSAIPLVPATVSNPTSGTGSLVIGGPPPDFDNGFGPIPDGPYINKPDEGVIFSSLAPTNRPYFDNINIGNGLGYPTFASPERQVPSPVMFGSLPTGAPVGALAAKPWQTLLFQPGPTGHTGTFTPKDEYLLDLFWMPQSEPYAISEPFSTAGKINLNYQILPFTYIDRSTAIQSVLSVEKVAVVAASQAQVYKHQSDTTGSNATETTPLRTTLNLSEKDGTLSQFVQRFNNFDFFHAAAEICDVYLVPSGLSWTPVAGAPTGSPPVYKDTAAQTAWYGNAFGLVGDNTREKPYADIYSRITTKSNSFTVYYRVQTLKNPPTSAAASWTEGQGAILGDYRGSTTLERYIDPNDKTIPDYTADITAANLESHYKWRVVENNRFSP